MIPRDIVKLAFQYQETEFVPYLLEIDNKKKEEITKYYGNDNWKKSIVNYVSYSSLTGVDNFLSLNMGFENLYDAGKMSIQKDSFGCTWKLGTAAQLIDPPLHEPTVGNYHLPDLDNYFKNYLYPRWPEEINSTTEQFRVITHSFGLFERSWSLRGFNDFLIDLICNEKFVDELLECITEWFLQSVDLMVGGPIDAIMFTDDHAGQRGMLMSENMWRKFFKPRWKRIYERVHHYGIYTIMHMCGNNTSIIPDLIEIGLDCMESCQPECMDIYSLKKKFGKNIRFWGGLGVQNIMPFGTEEKVRIEIRRLKKEMGSGGGYLLAGAKPFGEDIPIRNIIAFLEEANLPRF